MKNVSLLILVLAVIISCKSKKQVIAHNPSGGSKKIEKPSDSLTPILTDPDQLEQDIEKGTVILESIDDPYFETGVEEIPVEITGNSKVISVFDHSLFNDILKMHVTADGRVDYAGIKKNKAPLTSYLKLLENTAPTSSWRKNEKLVYYMNAYNAMTIDLIVRNYPLMSIKDIKDPWEQRYWKIDNKWINLDEIEHKILRKMNEPRIHFGINCASFSCPPLMNEAFTADKVEQQLEKLAIQFVNDPKNTITEERVEISKIFKWFKGDFTNNGDVIDFLNKYSKVKINKNARVRYMDYDWELNE